MRPPERAETVGERLRRLRVGGGFSQRDLSSPGITYAYISRIEAGARTPSVKALRMLAQKLNVTPEYLETGSELASSQLRELRLAEQELRLRLEGEADLEAVRGVLAEAEGPADTAATIRGRIVLGLAAAARGDHSEAVANLSQVVGSELVSPAARPDVYTTLGRSLAAAGLARRAVTLFEGALGELERSGSANAGARVRYATYLSYALTDLGELQRARAVVEELTASAGDAVDPYTQVRLHWSLGRLSLEQARPLAALDSFRRAVALLEATEDTVQLARAHVSCAGALVAGNEGAADAQKHLAKAELLLGDHAADDDLAAVRRLQAMCAVAAGDAETAQALGQEALLLAGDLPNERGNAWWAIASARAAGAEGDADEAYREAVALLGEHGTVRELAGLLRAYGRYLRESGRELEALDVFERAADVAANLQGDATGVER